MADLSARVVAEGVVRLAAADALAERSNELTAEAIEIGMTGIEEVSTAAELRGAARDERAASVAETAAGAELGAVVEAVARQT